MITLETMKFSLNASGNTMWKRTSSDLLLQAKFNCGAVEDQALITLEAKLTSRNTFSKNKIEPPLAHSLHSCSALLTIPGM